VAEVILMFKDSIGHYPPFSAQQKLLVAPQDSQGMQSMIPFGDGVTMKKIQLM